MCYLIAHLVRTDRKPNNEEPLALVVNKQTIL